MEGVEIEVGGSVVRDYTLNQMVAAAEVQMDGSAIFEGTPRPFMEKVGTSSGPVYAAIRKMGCVQTGRGPTATWYIPPEVVVIYRDLNEEARVM